MVWTIPIDLIYYSSYLTPYFYFVDHNFSTISPSPIHFLNELQTTLISFHYDCPHQPFASSYYMTQADPAYFQLLINYSVPEV